MNSHLAYRTSNVIVMAHMQAPSVSCRNPASPFSIMRLGSLNPIPKNHGNDTNSSQLLANEQKNEIDWEFVKLKEALLGKRTWQGPILGFLTVGLSSTSLSSHLLPLLLPQSVYINWLAVGQNIHLLVLLYCQRRWWSKIVSHRNGFRFYSATRGWRRRRRRSKKYSRSHYQVTEFCPVLRQNNSSLALWALSHRLVPFSTNAAGTATMGTHTWGPV